MTGVDEPAVLFINGGGLSPDVPAHACGGWPWRAHVAVTFADGLRLNEQERPDIVVLDRELPGSDDFGRLLGAASSPFVILASRHATLAWTVAALNQGAADVIASPIEQDELVARIQALLRRRPDFKR